MSKEIPNGAREADSNPDPGEKFRRALNEIQGRSLTPDNIDSYAEDALSDLIKLSDGVTWEYLKGNDLGSSSWKDLEDKAFASFGLGNLGIVLDHVASVDAQMRQLDVLIGQVRPEPHVLVPPQAEMQPIVPGEKEYIKPGTISRTKTVLFILANDFNVDLSDESKVRLTSGILANGMMRQQSYFMIELPELNRTILVCDEEGNVSYVFDNQVLERLGISPEDLAKLNKNEINDLLSSEHGLGRRVVYTESFVGRMTGLMTDISHTTSHVGKNEGRFLVPKAPEGFMSLSGMVKKFKVQHSVIRNAIEDLGEALGEANPARIGGQVAPVYAPIQQEMIKENLEKKGAFLGAAPKGFFSLVSFAGHLGLDPRTVQKAVDDLGDQLGEVPLHKFGSVVSKAYSLEQQAMIEQTLEAAGVLAQEAPEGTLSEKALASKFGMDPETLRKATEAVDGELGKVENYKFYSQVTRGYNPDQQEIIERHLRDNGYFTYPPEGVLALHGIAAKNITSTTVISRIIDSLGEALGEVNIYRFRTRVTAGYTPEQQEMIETVLEKKRRKN